MCGLSEYISIAKASRIGPGTENFTRFFLLDPSTQLAQTRGEYGPGVSAPGPKSLVPPKEAQRARGTSRHLTYATLLMVTDGINMILAASLVFISY